MAKAKGVTDEVSDLRTIVAGQVGVMERIRGVFRLPEGEIIDVLSGWCDDLETRRRKHEDGEPEDRGKMEFRPVLMKQLPSGKVGAVVVEEAVPVAAGVKEDPF